MTWLTATVAGATEFDRVFGLRPNLYDDYRAFVSLFWSLRPVDPVILELCRLRIAQLFGCDAELRVRHVPADAAGLTEEKIAALENWRTAGEFSDAERACLAFAEKFVLNPHGVTDEDAAAVTAHLSDKETIAFAEALAVFDGFTRFRIILGIEPDV
jgi:alkylhydroperoxidase family enzyme